jgi:tetratricopeptide (TPR) repeat protein
MLSANYQRIKNLRSTGKSEEAYRLLMTAPPQSDRDAFEAAICLFVCGDLASVQHVCNTHPWQPGALRSVAHALTILVTQGDPADALAVAESAAADPDLPHDAMAICLMAMQGSGAHDRADAFVRQQVPEPPPDEILLLTVMAEIAVSVRDWRNAYRYASAVMFADPDDYRALLALSRMNLAVGNHHEALGNALRALKVMPGAAEPVGLMMRCHNKLGDFYAAIGVSNELPAAAPVPAEVHTELGTAYAGIGDAARAEAAFSAALNADAQSPGALHGLASVFAESGDFGRLDNLEETFHERLHGDINCLSVLGKAALARHDLARAGALFEESRLLAIARRRAAAILPWPVPDPRVRHDVEQLELLQQRGVLSNSGQQALAVLKRHFRPGSAPDHCYAPTGAAEDEFRTALTTVFHCPIEPYSGNALGNNDYGDIERRYLEGKPPVVAIDNFLSPEALRALRKYCEEATVWKLSAGEGYLGALLPEGFAPPVLLEITEQLRRAMPQVIGDYPLLQAWGFKYDQRLQGINMHADFAKVNVNFWVTPEEGCADKTTGGMVVYDVPAPESWTFADYNMNQTKMRAFLEASNAKSMRVPFRENRCVIFDSSLIHITDELRFRPGYTNRRINVTLLYGRARKIG